MQRHLSVALSEQSVLTWSVCWYGRRAIEPGIQNKSIQSLWLSLQGLEECMLFIAQAVALSIWFIKKSAYNQGVYTCIL